MNERIAHIKADFLRQLAYAHSLEELERIRIHFLGRQSALSELTKQMRELKEEEKRVIGPLLTSVKAEMTEAFEKAHASLLQKLAFIENEKQRNFDVTASRPTPLKGSLHIYSQIIEKLEDIFISMGFAVVDGPEVETDYYNFEALNIPSNHPARDMQDTFWLDIPGLLLRTQTSNVQIRVMEKTKPPLAIVSPGRVYRNEARDASHEFMFMQLECLYIDKNVSMANLFYTTQTFLEAVFEKETKIRVRPSYFPFVEPGVEIDASCPFCTKGCAKCKYSGWIELLGAGLIHPHVLRAVGINPDEYTGFAFGMGIERLAIIKHDIEDIRLFKSNKISFLEQF